jgi:hypothetical protein
VRFENTTSDSHRRRRGAPGNAQRLPRLLAGLGLLFGVGGALVLTGLGRPDVAYHYALGFGAAFVVTWIVKAWEHGR